MADTAQPAELPHRFMWATMVPELLVSELASSLHFWCGLCGFRVAYDRPEDRFAYKGSPHRSLKIAR